MNYLKEQIERNIEDLFFCNYEQICLAKKIVSFSIYETEAIFHANKL